MAMLLVLWVGGNKVMAGEISVGLPTQFLTFMFSSTAFSFLPSCFLRACSICFKSMLSSFDSTPS